MPHTKERRILKVCVVCAKMTAKKKKMPVGRQKKVEKQRENKHERISN